MTDTAAILNLIGSVEIVICTLFALLSVVEMSRVNWRKTAMGRHLMAYMTVLAAVFLLTVIAIGVRLLGGADVLWFQILRLVVFSAMPFVLWQRWRLIRRARRGDI